jgi:hypothetical protein
VTGATEPNVEAASGMMCGRAACAGHERVYWRRLRAATPERNTPYVYVPKVITKHFSPVSPVSVYSMKPKPDLKPRNFFETDFGFTRFQRDFLKPESET